MNEYINDKIRIRNAFKELRRLGWFARMNFWCCQTCGCAAVPDKAKNKFVFYHKQDAEAINKNTGNINGHGMYMTHGEGGNGTEIMEVLNKHGLSVTWNGNNDTRILVAHKD